MRRIILTIVVSMMFLIISGCGCQVNRQPINSGEFLFEADLSEENQPLVKFESIREITIIIVEIEEKQFDSSNKINTFKTEEKFYSLSLYIVLMNGYRWSNEIKYVETNIIGPPTNQHYGITFVFEIWNENFDILVEVFRDTLYFSVFESTLSLTGEPILKFAALLERI